MRALALGLGERHGIFAHLVVHLIDELFASVKRGVGYLDRVLGGERAHREFYDAGWHLHRQLRVLGPILHHLLDGLVRRKAREPIDVIALVEILEPDAPVQGLDHGATLHVVQDDLRILHDERDRDALAFGQAGHAAAHGEARLRDVLRRGEEEDVCSEGEAGQGDDADEARDAQQADKPLAAARAQTAGRQATATLRREPGAARRLAQRAGDKCRPLLRREDCRGLPDDFFAHAALQTSKTASRRQSQ